MLDLQQLEEGFESTDEMQERKIEDPNKPKAIVTAANEFVTDAFEWNKNTEE